MYVLLVSWERVRGWGEAAMATVATGNTTNNPDLISPRLITPMDSITRSGPPYSNIIRKRTQMWLLEGVAKAITSLGNVPKSNGIVLDLFKDPSLKSEKDTFFLEIPCVVACGPDRSLMMSFCRLWTPASNCGTWGGLGPGSGSSPDLRICSCWQPGIGLLVHFIL